MDKKIKYLYETINKYVVTDFFKLHFIKIVFAFEAGYDKKRPKLAEENINRWFFNFIQELRIDEKTQYKLRKDFITLWQ